MLTTEPEAIVTVTEICKHKTTVVLADRFELGVTCSKIYNHVNPWHATQDIRDNIKLYVEWL